MGTDLRSFFHCGVDQAERSNTGQPFIMLTLIFITAIKKYRGGTVGSRFSLLPSGLIDISVKSRRDDGLRPVAADKRFHRYVGPPRCSLNRLPTVHCCLDE